MALINCPECGKEISDKSEVCINCGYPIATIKKYWCTFEGNTYDTSSIADELLSGEIDDSEAISVMTSEMGCNVFEASYIVKQIKETGFPPRVMHNITLEDYKKNAPPRCPKCGSTDLTTSARGVSLTRGFIGASKTVFRCSKCGNAFKPSKALRY